MKKYIFIIVICLLSAAFSSVLSIQDTTNSLAFKKNRPHQTSPYFYRPDLAYQIWQQFRLIQEANAGDPLAQHELGLRYLLGEGIPADTVQAIQWIRKAADKNLAAAKYNYGIMLINGIGVQWNPFSAFRYFKSAANDGMAQAQYVVGILYTDNLIITRNWNLAYFWIKKSADGEFKPAQKILTQLEPKISNEVVDSLFNHKTFLDSEEEKSIEKVDNTALASGLGLSFIDFDAVKDSAIEITDSMVVADIEIMSADSLVAKLKIDSVYSFAKISASEKTEILIELADYGNPEAQTILGRMYEQGIYFRKNEITAASYYYRALRYDSPKSTNLLWQLSRKREFLNQLQSEVNIGSAEAEFVWYGLVSTGFNSYITLEDALGLLKNSASKYYLPAMIELGLNYYTGRFVSVNPDNGILIWEGAKKLRSNEAAVRLLTASIFDSFASLDKRKDVEILKNFAEQGSLLAQVSLAMCFENGIGINKSKAEAVQLFRMAAQRGSHFAYEKLKSIYDELRPPDPEFIISN